MTRLKHEGALRKVIDQDYQLLTRVAQQEFVKALVVYTLIGILFVVGVAACVYVQTRPAPLAPGEWTSRAFRPKRRGSPWIPTIWLSCGRRRGRARMPASSWRMRRQARAEEQIVSSADGGVNTSTEAGTCHPYSARDLRPREARTRDGRVPWRLGDEQRTGGHAASLVHMVEHPDISGLLRHRQHQPVRCHRDATSSQKGKPGASGSSLKS